jgi:hypothetical protein
MRDERGEDVRLEKKGERREESQGTRRQRVKRKE